MQKEDLEILQKEWFKMIEPSGKMLGYPDCCIKEFGDQPPELLRISTPTEEDYQRYYASLVDGMRTGFIPCIFHAKQILAKKITLESLIQNRSITLPKFPKA